MNQKKSVAIMKQALMAFVLITVGFAIGKEVTLRRVQRAETENKHPMPASGDNKIVVSYAHATQRCVNCNTIERLVRETIDEQFAEAVGRERLAFREVNYQEDTAFARDYAIAANSVILHRIVQGQESDYQQLDRIWELFRDAPAFKQYLAEAIRSDLANLPGDDA